jgi:hypothetical protein
MAASARYQPAPQRDSLEEPGVYSQAPPSYQATEEAPRSEDDNVPDDFKVFPFHVWKFNTPFHHWMLEGTG